MENPTETTVWLSDGWIFPVISAIAVIIIGYLARAYRQKHKQIDKDRKKPEDPVRTRRSSTQWDTEIKPRLGGEIKPSFTGHVIPRAREAGERFNAAPRTPWDTEIKPSLGGEIISSFTGHEVPCASHAAERFNVAGPPPSAMPAKRKNPTSANKNKVSKK